MNFCLIEDRLLNEWRCISKVREMGPYKILVTFEVKEDMEEALNIGKKYVNEVF